MERVVIERAAPTCQTILCVVLHYAAQCSMTFPPLKTIRVSVPFAPDVLEKFQRFSDASGLSLAKSISDWCRDTVQGLDAMTEILEVHKTKPREAMAKLQSLANSLQVVSEQAMKNMEDAPSPLGEGVPLAGKSLAVARAAITKAAKSPRLVIRGGNSPANKAKKL